MSTSHRIVNPSSLPAPAGFSHAVVAAPGRTVYLGGQTAQLPDGSLKPGSMVQQFDVAAENLVRALKAAEAQPQHLVSLQIFVTDVAEYRASLKELGTVYRRHFGRHYPAIALFEVRSLFDPLARVELVAVAVIPGTTLLDTGPGR